MKSKVDKYIYILGGGHGNPLQHSCLKDHMDRGARWAMVHRVAELDPPPPPPPPTQVYIYIFVFI